MVRIVCYRSMVVIESSRCGILRGADLVARKPIDDAVRAALRGDPAKAASALDALVELRQDSFGNYFFVRKGAPVDLDEIQLEDRVDIDELRDFKRKAKRERYLAHKKNTAYPGPFILAEGDSWFEFPLAKDLIECAGGPYAVLSLARAGDTWANIIDQDSEPEKKYPDETPMGLRHTLARPDIRPFTHVMLSVGGNDLIGQLRFCVHTFDPERLENDYINRRTFDAVLKSVLENYKSVISDLLSRGPSVIVHTYDYPNPKSGGQYIGSTLEKYCEFPASSVPLMRHILNQMIDLFHFRLSEIVGGFNGKAHLIDLRKTIGTDDTKKGPNAAYWKDEMHANDRGVELLWGRMEGELKKIVHQG